ncbi:MAG: arsenate reductase ArsC [Gammaproteobacteria bacterium]|nr:arsenate reductase ArsC [Gammaproteobacteria bacterium]
MNILFLCVANSARSQMAEGLAKNMLGKDFSIMSAGSFSSYVHPVAIKVMSEIGIDISKQTSKSINDIDLSHIDMIITLCAEEVCPYVAGDIKKHHWPMPDPAKAINESEQLALFREIRDSLKVHIELLKIN